MKRVLIAVAAVLLAGLTAAYHWSARLEEMLAVPPAAFDLRAVPPAPRYEDAAAWIARPDREDIADAVPAGAVPGNQQALTGVDAFVVLPVPADPRDRAPDGGWNMPADGGWHGGGDPALTWPSIFNACCRVFVPRYRAATAAAFLRPDSPSAAQAQQLAYDDIAAAFRTYLGRWNKDRPLVLAGAGQGAAHLQRLMGEIARTDPAVAGRIIVAYLPGAPLPLDLFAGPLRRYAPCRAPGQTGCIAAWSSRLAGTPATAGGQAWDGDGRLAPVDGRGLLCVNPVTFAQAKPRSRQGEAAGGTVWSPGEHGPEPLTPGLVAAECRQGWLEISPPDPAVFRLLARDGDYGPYDAALFWADIRADSLSRLRSWAAGHRRFPPSDPAVTVDNPPRPPGPVRPARTRSP